MARLPAGTTLPPVLKQLPTAYDVAWLGILPTASPALSADEQAKVRAIKDGASDQRIVTRAAAILVANGTP